MSAGPLRLRLPATSANLGPAFDAAALALALFLEVDAEAAPAFSIQATGRNVEVCGTLAPNLMLHTYRHVWAAHAGTEPAPLALQVHNEIPIGMGCGSSAAARLAGIALTVHFAGLRWSRARILDEAAALERHPDNAAACVHGGFTVAGMEGTHVRAVRFAPPLPWRALLALPAASLPTAASRSVLPGSYPREAVVPNLQNIALLTAAFATGNGSLLAAATRDRLHQPFRAEVCPLLPSLLPLVGHAGILSVTLSGAGSGVLLLLGDDEAGRPAAALVREALKRDALAELLPCKLCTVPAVLAVSDSGT